MDKPSSPVASADRVGVKLRRLGEGRARGEAQEGRMVDGQNMRLMSEMQQARLYARFDRQVKLRCASIRALKSIYPNAMQASD
jgi:hypothetical protein